MAKAPRWLSDEEQTTWRAFLATTQLLDEALDRQLQRDAGMPHAYYAVLVALDSSPDATLRMSDLARLLRYSQSRMTHAVARLERDGWVRRQQCPTDRRGQLAVLTPAGRDALVAAAPGHVTEVREKVFDRLSPTQVTQLRRICQTLLDGLDTSGVDPRLDPRGGAAIR
jgi:DNA-binding MarR family transcriptional regulator